MGRTHNSPRQRDESAPMSAPDSSPTLPGRDERPPSSTASAARRLSPADSLTAITLHRKGHSKAAIAKVLGASPTLVAQALTDARSILEAYAPKLAADAVLASDIAAKKGNHRPALDLLERLDVVKPPLDPNIMGGGASGPSVSVQIFGLALPGLPKPAAGVQVIDVASSTPSPAKPEHRSEGQPE